MHRENVGEELERLRDRREKFLELVKETLNKINEGK